MSAAVETLADLVRTKIENLRPKLLDLSRRNPLISTKLGPRSNSHIRAVDELPDVLFFKLNNAQEMNLVALPAIEEDPRDEQTGSFRDALINARLTDDVYLSAMGAAESDSDSYLDKTREIERALKDQIRAQLGLAPRVQRTEINLIQHAKNNGISPSYELPDPPERNDDGRHTDDDIQTLLLPTDLERKLNAILSKTRTWVQETGMNVLQIGFGFLEWSDDAQSDSSFAPLVLLQAEIKKYRTPQGTKYSITGSGDEPELNAVLAEKLRIEFGIELPTFSGASIEAYVAEVASVLPKKKNWRIRRQVAIGVFPSARMAMYHDLDPKQPNFPENDIVHSLLAGNDAAGASPFADEYEVDQPEIENKVPCLVVDADSSQFSALVDIGDGKNVAVEGPPGTGKSQTIVNAIAAALGAGKKVLFVAEKLAALNVVKARLEAIGLGEYLLPLQAEKSTREQVIESIRNRLDMRDSRAVRDYDEKLEEFRQVRHQLAIYIDLITRQFAESGLTVHDILGKSIVTNSRLSGLPTETLERCSLQAEMQTSTGFKALLDLGAHLETAHSETLSAAPNWKETKLVYPERFTVEEACSLAQRASAELLKLAGARNRLAELGLDSEELPQTIATLDHCLAGSEGLVDANAQGFLISLLTAGKAKALLAFLERCDAVRDAGTRIAGQLTSTPDAAALDKIVRVDAICEKAAISTIKVERLMDQLEARSKAANTVRSIASALEPLVAACDSARSWQLSDIGEANTLFKAAGRDAIIYRGSSTSAPDKAYLLRKLCEEGSKLNLQRTSLEERLSLSIEVSIGTLVDCAAALRTAGPLSFLSGPCRNAKRIAKSLSRGSGYSKVEAVRSLDELISFRRKTDEFEKQSEASGAFGAHYRGLDTEFEKFKRLAEFQEGIEAKFGSARHASLRKFLLEAAIGELDLLPALPTNALAMTFTTLQERMIDSDVEVAALRAAIEALRDDCKIFKNEDIDPATVKIIRHELEAMLTWQSALNADNDARELLAESFAGHLTPTEGLREAAAWALASLGMAPLVLAVLSRCRPAAARALLSNVLATSRDVDGTLMRLADVAKIDTSVFTKGRLVPDASASLALAASDPEGLFAHATFATALLDAQTHGVMPLVEERLGTANSLDGLAGQIEALAARQLAKAMYGELGSKLTKYRGAKLDELRKALAEKDREILQLSRQQLRAKIKASARPPMGNGMGRKSTWTDMALIENEISKKQKFVPVRDLTQRAGNALLELKPCWMMSPLAVAQYVPKGIIKFDLCIIDEASQMPPESAIGALLRSNQAVVVGDTNQLPPSSFFKTLIDDEEADDDESVLNESVLEMANATFRPARRLRWHYRSRHSGLIKFSNRLVYDDNLIVFPSATEAMSRMGVEYRRIVGRYKAGTNPIEAKAVVDAIIEFMRVDPDRSLGVVTLNQKQRDLITEEFEYTIANNRSVQKYVDTWKERNDGLEEFFIKNLENVQGDERDVIFIGTVYGAEEPGTRVMQRFGPINGLAGRRRLNVLLTRAKQKIVTFSSMTAADIEADEHNNPGTYMLKRWLEYSASGVLDAGAHTQREPDSDFEVFVIDQIRGMGCTPVPQVGVAGYFVDIGIRHPEWQHGFILGVECDGATYHSAKSARDRDRLRQEILEGLGWQLHRIWSTDWFNNPKQEAERLRKVIVERLGVLKAREHEFVQAPTPPPTVIPVLPVAKPITLDLFVADLSASAIPFRPAIEPQKCVEIGDTVRVRYLNEDQKTVRITISNSQSDTSRGIVHHRTPLASALLGAEEGDEIEVLVGSYIRSAVIEAISKSVQEPEHLRSQ